MNTAASPHLAHAQASDLYDPDDDVLPKNSPLMQPTRVTLRLSPTLPLTVPFPTSHPSQGDAVLLGALDGGRRPDIAFKAAAEPLPSDTDEEDASEIDDSSSDGAVALPSYLNSGAPDQGGRAGTPGEKDDGESMAVDPPDQGDMGAFDLKSLAAGALAFAVPDAKPDNPAVNAGLTPPVSEHDVAKEKLVPPPLSHPIAMRQGDPVKEERVIQPGVPSPYSPQSLYSPRNVGAIPSAPMTDMKSPNGLPTPNHRDGLPPIQMHSPRSDSNVPTPLPSIRSQLGDLDQLANKHVAEKERLRHPHHAFPHSPPGLPPFGAMHHGSPPISPAETFRRDPLSPGHSFNPGYLPPNFSHHRSPHEYGGSSTVTPGSEQSGSTSVTMNDKMSIEGITTQPVLYVCTFQGCTAAPFQTQYLLNSHANVHSSARPHYCPVEGCPRGERGKGFKRKNEMIRHGLVHESPGYVCPFCPDREHKYPRPDNLQRHVRVHHSDKNKDDPLLRDVLAQRPDGPNKGRRRRGNQP